MIANALILTIAVLLALGFWLLGELKFLAPYKTLLLQLYATRILLFLAMLFVNVFAFAFAINRRFFLKDTGRKLSHLDKQLQVGGGDLAVPALDAIDEELN
jgi:hypothetical protein